MTALSPARAPMLTPVLIDTLRQEGGLLRLRDHPHLRGQAQRAVATGQLVKLLPGIVTPAPLARDATMLARAVRLHDPAALLLGRSAARATHWPEMPVTTTEVAVGRAPRLDPPPGLVFHRLAWPSELVTDSEPLLATTLPASTLWAAEQGDLGPLFAGLRNHLTVDDLRAAVRLAPRGHRDAWHRIVREVHKSPWSHPELGLHQHFRRRGVTGWKANLKVAAGGRDHYLDIAFEREQVGLEVESREFHEKWEDLKKDWRRHNRLTVAGWRILHTDTDRILRDPDGVVDEVCAMVHARSALRRRA